MKKNWFSTKWRVLANFFASGLFAIGFSLAPVGGFAADVVVINGSTHVNVNVTDTQTVTVENNATGQITNGEISGAIINDTGVTIPGTIEKTTDDELTVNAHANTDFSGTVKVLAGSMFLNGDGALNTVSSWQIGEDGLLSSTDRQVLSNITGDGTIHNEVNGDLVLNNTGDLHADIANHGSSLTLNGGMYYGTISGAGPVVIGGGSTVGFGGTHTYTGATVLENAALLGLEMDNAIYDSHGVVMAENSRIDMLDTEQLFRVLRSEADSSIRIHAGGELTVWSGEISGVISGAGDFIKDSAEELTFHTAQEYTGTSTFNGGTTVLDINNTLADSENVIIGKDATVKTWIGPMPDDPLDDDSIPGVTQQNFKELSGEGTLIGGTIVNNPNFDSGQPESASNPRYISGMTTFTPDKGDFAGGIHDSSDIVWVSGGEIVPAGTAGAYEVALGNAALNIEADKTFTLSGGENKNTYSGTTTVAGELIGGADSSFSANSDHIVSGLLNLQGTGQSVKSLSGAGNVALGATGELRIANDYNSATVAEFSGEINGAGKVFVDGALNLSGVNQYTGETVVTENGDLLLSGSNAIDTSSRVRIEENGLVTLAAGTEQVFQELYSTVAGTVDINTDLTGTTPDQIATAGSLTINKVDYNGNINLGDDQTANAGELNEYTVKAQLELQEGTLQSGSSITGEGNIIKTGSGTLNILGDNRGYEGEYFQADGGTIGFNNANAFGSAAIEIVTNTTFATIGGSEITLSNDFFINQFNGVENNNPPQTLTFDTADGKLTIDGTISGIGGNLAKTGSGTLVINNETKYDGTTTVEEGRILFVGDNAISGSSGIKVAEDGILDIGTTIQTIQSGYIAGNIVGSGTIIKDLNPETLRIVSENAQYEGTTEIRQGTISINNGLALGATEDNTVTIAGGKLQGTEDFWMENAFVLETTQNADGIELANMIEVSTGKTVRIFGTIGDAVDDNGSLMKIGEGTLIVHDAVNTGWTDIREGTLQAGEQNALSENSIHNLYYDSVLDLGGADQKVAAVTGYENSELRLGNGTLTVGDDSGTPYADADGFYVYRGTITGDNSSIGNLDNTQTQGYFNEHTGIDKVGETTWLLTGQNTYAGQTKFTGGQIRIFEDANLGDGGGWVFHGGDLRISGTIENDRNIYVQSDSAGNAIDKTEGGLIVDAGHTVTLNGVISDRISTDYGTFVKDGEGTLVVTGLNENRYTWVNDGKMVGNTDSLQGGITVDNDNTVDGKIGTLVFDQDFDGIFNFREGGFYNDPTLQFLEGTDMGLFGGGIIEKRGSGMLEIVTDNSDFAGTTNVYDGTLRVGDYYEYDGRDLLYSGILGGDVVVAPDYKLGDGYAPTLSGNGLVGGDVTIMTDGYLAPNNLTAEWTQFDRADLGLSIGGNLNFAKEDANDKNENAGTFLVNVNNQAYGSYNGLWYGVSDYVSLGGGQVNIISGTAAVSGGFGQVGTEASLGTRLAINSISSRCSYNFAFAKPLVYSIIEGAYDGIEGDFQLLYNAEGKAVYSKDAAAYDNLIANIQVGSLLDVELNGIDYLPRFLGFTGVKVDTNDDGVYDQYAAVLGKSDWDFHTPVEAVAVSGTEKPYSAGSHNQSEVGNALNCVLTSLGNRYDAVNDSFNTYDPVSGTWHNPYAYRDSVWNEALCNLGNPDITVAQYREAYNQLAGDIKANSLYLGLNAQHRSAFNHMAFDPFYQSGRRNTNTCNDVGCGDSSSSTNCGKSCCSKKVASCYRTDFWFDGNYVGGRFKTDGNSQGFDMNGGGFTVGLGRDYGCRRKVGIMLGYLHPELQDKYGKVSNDDFRLGLYGGTTWHNCFELLGYVGGGIQDYDLRRTIYSDILVESPSQLTSSYKGHSFEVAGEIALPLEVSCNRFWLRPYLGLDYRKAWQDSVVENGHDIYALDFAKADMDQLMFRLGIDSEIAPSKNLLFRGRFGWEYQALGDGKYPQQRSSFVGNGYPCNMDIHGLELGRSRFVVGAGAQWYINKSRGMSLIADYEISSMNRGTYHWASLGYQWLY